MRYVPFKVTLHKEKNDDTGIFELVVNVENTLGVPIQWLNLMWCFDYDDPLPDELAKSEKVAEFLQFGEGPLEPGQTRQFVYPPDELPALLSVVDALSPERYFLLINFDGNSERVFSGPEFGSSVQREFI